MPRPLALPLAIATVATIVLLLGAAPPLTGADYVTLGEAQAQRGDAKRAFGTLDKALADTALSAELRARAEKAYGLALLQQNRGKDAAAHIEKAVALNAKDEKAWALLGMAYDAALDFPTSIAAYARGVAAVPKSAALQHEYGMALLQTGQSAEAANALVAAAKLAEQDAEVLMDAAYALSMAGRFKEARAHAELAVSLDPQSPDAYFNLGTALAGTGDLKGARAAYEKALELDELHVPALLDLGLLLQATRNDGEAVKRFTRVLQVEPDNPRATAGLGGSLARLGTDDKQARALLLAVVQADPKNALAHAMLGDISERAGELDDAIARYSAVKKLKPDDGVAKKKLDALLAAKKAQPAKGKR